MFRKKATLAEKTAAREKIALTLEGAKEIDDIPVREFMLKWLQSFAPDMPVYDAKAFCLPKMFFKNYLWHAFSFQKTDCYIGEDATAEYRGGFEGECYVLLNGENLLFTVEDGTALTLEKVEEFTNIIIFKKDFSETFVHTGSKEFGPYYKSADMAIADGSEPDESYVPEEDEELPDSDDISEEISEDVQKDNE